MRRYFLVLVLFLLPVAPSLADSFAEFGIRANNPPGFTGPVSAGMSQGKTYGYSKPSRYAGVHTLLQFSAFDMGKPPPRLTHKELWAATDKYLSQFLQGVERRRTSFIKGAPVHIYLGGQPASRIQWKGQARGMKTNGVMYCLIVGHYIVSIHTQDGGYQPTANMKDAINAIEALAVSGT